MKNLSGLTDRTISQFLSFLNLFLSGVLKQNLIFEKKTNENVL